MAHFQKSKGASSHAYEVIAFSSRGAGHRAKEQDKQDYCNYKDLDSLGLLAVVSDGVGSCPRSREGAESVVNTSLETLEHSLRSGISSMEASAYHWRAWIATSVEKNRKNLLQLLREDDPDYSADKKINNLFSATQLIAWTNGNQFVTSIVGDGAIVGIKKNHEGELIHDDLANVSKLGLANEVIPVTLPNWERGWMFQGPLECADYEGVIIMTDGFSDSAGDALYTHLWERLFNEEQKTQESAPSEKDETEEKKPEENPDGIKPADTPAEKEGVEKGDNEESTQSLLTPEEFLNALSRHLEDKGYTKDDKTLIAVKFNKRQ